MKKIKKLIIAILFISLICVSLIACRPKQQKYEKQATQMLKEKYNEEFQIVKYLKHQRMSDNYEVIAFSNNYPNILFEAKVALDGSYITDEYVASRVCCKIEENIKNNMSEFQECMQIKVQAISKSINSNEADMSIQKFMSMKTKNRFVIYITYNPINSNRNDLYQNLSNIFSNLEYINGSIKLYITNEKVLKQVEQYLSENAKVDYEFDVALEHKQPITILFENGIINLSKQEFENEINQIM